MSEMVDQLIVEVTLPAPIDVAWRALRDPAEIRRWFGWDYDALDEEIKAIFFADDAVCDDAAHSVSWPDGDRFVLDEVAGGTRLRVTKPAPADVDWDTYYEDVRAGWLAFTWQLAFALTRHPGQDRRTIFLAGESLTPGDHPIQDAFGANAIASIAPGERYEFETPFGEVLAGEVLFRNARQIGLTVDAYGDGLIVASSAPPSAIPPHGGGDMVITTYGLDDDAHEAIAQRWAGWRRDHINRTPTWEKYGSV
jgi:hypothetical protein